MNGFCRDIVPDGTGRDIPRGGLSSMHARYKARATQIVKGPRNVFVGACLFYYLHWRGNHNWAVLDEGVELQVANGWHGCLDGVFVWTLT